MAKTLAALLAAVFLVPGPTGLARQGPAVDFSRLGAVVAEELRNTGTPGGAIAVVLGDRVVYTKAFGIANVETNEPVRPEMLFRLGSTTKMFTAAALVTLAERGAIDLDVPVGSYVPGLNAKVGRVTGDQLLSHQSGFFDEAPMLGSNDESALEKEVRSWTDSRFFTEPGKIFSYSNPGIGLNTTAEMAMQIGLSSLPPRNSSTAASSAHTATEMNAYVGTYSQGPRTIELLVRDGTLVLKQNNREQSVVISGDGLLVSGGRWVVVRNASGAVEYLHAGSRSWRKVK